MIFCEVDPGYHLFPGEIVDWLAGEFDASQKIETALVEIAQLRREIAKAKRGGFFTLAGELRVSLRKLKTEVDLLRKHQLSMLSLIAAAPPALFEEMFDVWTLNLEEHLCFGAPLPFFHTLEIDEEDFKLAKLRVLVKLSTLLKDTAVRIRKTCKFFVKHCACSFGDSLTSAMQF